MERLTKGRDYISLAFLTLIGSGGGCSLSFLLSSFLPWPLLLAGFPVMLAFTWWVWYDTEFN